jgi:hypothetical protein
MDPQHKIKDRVSFYREEHENFGTIQMVVAANPPGYLILVHEGNWRAWVSEDEIL